MFPASCPRLAHQRRNLDRFRIRQAEHVRAQLLPCRPQILARGEPRKPNGAPLLFLSSLGTAAAAHRSCPPETAMERGRRYLRDRRRCVHVLAACLTGGSRRIRSGPKRACATATGSTRAGAERIGTVTTARRRDGDRGPVPNAGWIAGWAGLAGLGAQPFGSSSPTRGVGLLRPPSLLSGSHSRTPIVVLGH